MTGRNDYSLQVENNRRHTDTEVAVLKEQIHNIAEKVDTLRVSIKEVHDCLDRNSEETHKLIKELRDADAAQHKIMSDKISGLEKWRWMMMGAGMILGSLGFQTVAKLLA